MVLEQSDFVLRDGSWVATVTLPSWRGSLDCRGPYGAVLSPDGTGEVDLVFAPEGRGDAPLSPVDLAQVQWLLDHEEAAFTSLTGALIRWCRTHGELTIVEDDVEAPVDVRSARDLRDLIGLTTVYVHGITIDDEPYVGFELGCLWDEEHGLGVLLCGTRVVRVGGADTASLRWLAERDAARVLGARGGAEPGGAS